jgi:glycosyltransferase involved in cell wall biosynthesis
MIELSVIICAHNPRRDYLRRVLDSLQGQTIAPARWELVLVDNASDRPLRDEWDLSWHPNARLILEPELGLSAARRRGMSEASAEILLFVDDDNVLASDYLAEGLRLGQEWPLLGTWGSGCIVPEFEVRPAERLTRLLYLLAVREVAAPRWTNLFQIEACPWGAGIFLRRDVATAYLDMSEAERMPISDRRGTSLMSGGDVELSYVACDVGLGIGIFPELKVAHLIPKERVSDSYLLRLHEGIAVSTRLLGYKWKNIRPSARRGLRDRLSMLKNVLLARGLDRRLYFSNLRADQVSTDMIGQMAQAGGAGDAG